MSERKLAILIGASEFPNSGGALQSLSCPGKDVAGLEATFKDKERCWFHEISVLYRPHHEILVRINEVLRDANKEDLVLIYYSGHGKLDAKSNLYLAGVNTDPTILRATAVPIDAIHDCLLSSRCARFVLILDCCYSGAVGADLESFSEGLAASVGRYVITSSTAIQKSEEKEGKDYSVFTGHLIDGLKSGMADSNGDGLISMDELFNYVQDEMRFETLQQPMHWSFGSAGSLVIAQTREIQTSVLRRNATLRLEEAKKNEDLPESIIKLSERLLSMSDSDLRQQKNGTASLFLEWTRGALTTKDFIERWYRLDSGLPATDQPAQVHREERWLTVNRARQPIFDLIAPTYLLDASYHFLDWNPAFDEIVAKPLGLIRGRHAEDFILSLENTREVVERAQRDFKPGHTPLVHVETLEFPSKKYGLVRFKKIASQLPSTGENDLIWSVTLNITSADEERQLWADLEKRLKAEVNWSKYAGSYDQMLLCFDEYHALLKRICGMVGEAQMCADLAAGTGNGAKLLLESNPTREVWAFEYNERMLTELRNKISDPKLGDRLRVFKGDLTISLHEFEESFFDAAIMINALYAIEERQKCLREIYRVLKPNGILVLSTSHRDTDVTSLFRAIQDSLSRQGLYQKMRSVVEDAQDRHAAMDTDIHHNTRDEIYDYIRSAGFELEEKIDSAYVDAVVIVRARKPVPIEQVIPPPPPVEPLIRDKIFFSYSRVNGEWLERFQTCLAPVNRNGTIKIWDDTQIQPGQEWAAEIKKALETTKVAVLLVSPNFLASPFIAKDELPPILDAAKSRGLKIIWVPVSASLYRHSAIEKYQSAHDPEQPLDMLEPGRLNQVMVTIANKIISAYREVPTRV